MTGKEMIQALTAFVRERGTISEDELTEYLAGIVSSLDAQADALRSELAQARAELEAVKAELERERADAEKWRRYRCAESPTGLDDQRWLDRGAPSMQTLLRRLDELESECTAAILDRDKFCLDFDSLSFDLAQCKAELADKSKRLDEARELLRANGRELGEQDAELAQCKAALARVAGLPADMKRFADREWRAMRNGSGALSSFMLGKIETFAEKLEAALSPIDPSTLTDPRVAELERVRANVERVILKVSGQGNVEIMNDLLVAISTAASSEGNHSAASNSSTAELERENAQLRGVVARVAKLPNSLRNEARISMESASGPRSFFAGCAAGRNASAEAIEAALSTLDTREMERDASRWDEARKLFECIDPPHPHKKPGFWDADGRECHECAPYMRLLTLLAAKPLLGGDRPAGPCNERHAERMAFAALKGGTDGNG